MKMITDFTYDPDNKVLHIHRTEVAEEQTIRRGDLDADLNLANKDFLGHGLTLKLDPALKQMIKDWPADREFTVRFQSSEDGQTGNVAKAFGVTDLSGVTIVYHEDPATNFLEAINKARVTSEKLAKFRP